MSSPQEIRQQIAQTLSRIKLDPQLGAELEDKRQAARDEAARRLGGLKLEVAMEGGTGGEPEQRGLPSLVAELPFPDDQRLLVEETIVLRQGRPVLTVTNDEARLELDAESEVWRERLQKSRSALAAAARATGRIEVTSHPRFTWLGTGWLIAPETIVTNRHVAREFGRDNGGKFVFRMGVGSKVMTGSIDFLEEAGREDEREFALQEILHIEDEDGPDLAFLRVRPLGSGLAEPLKLATLPAQERQLIAVIGYPARDSRIPDQKLMEDIFGNVYDKKRLAPGEVTGLGPAGLEHDCSTLGGNSGSVVMDLASGDAVALHFAGRFLRANYAVPSDVLRERLAQIGKGVRSPGPERPREAAAAPQPPASSPRRLSVTVPITIHVEVGEVLQAEPPALAPAPRPPAPGALPPPDEVVTEGRPEDYVDRDGYQPSFLDVDVPLPEIVTGKKDILTFQEDGATEFVLKYHHFSVVMSKSRRICRYSAVNIDGRLSKSSTRRSWRTDPRIPEKAQIMKECYGEAPKFSRGHMTRREDPAWGENEEEVDRGNRDSMHVTNTVPQLQTFNGGVWLQLEDYALQHARKDRMRISVFTGPVMRSDDAEEWGVKIPVTFWKIIAFIHDETGELCATGYTMSQAEDLAGREYVFGQHETTQTPIRVIEEATGLSFGELGELDPLAKTEEAVSPPLTALDEVRFY